MTTYFIHYSDRPIEFYYEIDKWHIDSHFLSAVPKMKGEIFTVVDHSTQFKQQFEQLTTSNDKPNQ